MSTPAPLAIFSESSPVREALAMRAGRAARQNWLILGAGMAMNAALLWLASHADGAMGQLLAALFFAFANNMLFALMHEAVHGNFDPSPARNRLGGSLAAAFFPTSFTLQCSAHLTHHRNNRSELERFDYIGPGESIPLKTAQWFSILTGLYWLGIPFFLVIYVLFAELVPWKKLVPKDSGFTQQTSAGEFMESLVRLPVWRVRAEFLFSLAVQLALAVMLDLSLSGWLLCYAAFALGWSSLQYADHAFSRLDRVEGSWNLRVNRFTRTMFLNYHYHLEHHRNPNCRWQDLPASKQQSGEPARPFLSMLLLMWKGPRLLPGAHQGAARQRVLDASVLTAHILIFGAAFALIYGLASHDFTARTSLYDVALPLDALAPFWPIWGLAYITITPLLLATAILLRTPDNSLPFLGALIFQLIVASVCFLLFPVTPPVPPAVPSGSFAASVFHIADAMNLEGNSVPSLHVSLALSCAWAAAARLKPVATAAMWLWALAIALSTWLTWQHWLVDIVAGALLAMIAMGVVRPFLARQLRQIEAEIIRD